MMHLKAAYLLAGALALTASACAKGDDRAGAADTATSRVATPAPDTGRVVADTFFVPPAARDTVAPRPTVKAHPDSVRPRPIPAAVAAQRSVRVNGVDLTGIGYDRGDPKAPVVIVNFSDFGCPYCGQFERETYPELHREYVETGKVFFKYVPFVAGMFPNAQQAARAAECAADQGKFWEMHDRLYATQAEWKRDVAPYGLFQKFAAALGLNADRFSSCYVGQQTDARTRRATEAANRLGVRVTPSFLVNGRPVQGALPLAEFRRIIESAGPQSP